jgi:hypothetical protein
MFAPIAGMVLMSVLGTGRRPPTIMNGYGDVAPRLQPVTAFRSWQTALCTFQELPQNRTFHTLFPEAVPNLRLPLITVRIFVRFVLSTPIEQYPISLTHI